MNCSDTQPQLSAYNDSERLEPATRNAIEAHLEHCPACRAELVSIRQMGQALRNHAERFRAPDLLRARLVRQIAAESAATSTPAAPTPMRRRLAGPALRYGSSFAAGIALVLALRWQPALHHEDHLIEDAVAGHVRSLMVDHLFDVASTDQHTVKPWFAGKIDFSPPTIDLADMGFPLVGGRLDYLAGHASAALVYRRRQHVINLFVWSQGPTADTPLQTQTLSGHTVLRWQAKGLHFCAVSDLNANELSTFASAIALRTISPSG
jgi:anti-sigma factor RsiW